MITILTNFSNYLACLVHMVFRAEQFVQRVNLAPQENCVQGKNLEGNKLQTILQYARMF